MNRFCYYIITYFIPSNKDYNSYCNPHSMYQMYPKLNYFLTNVHSWLLKFGFFFILTICISKFLFCHVFDFDFCLTFLLFKIFICILALHENENFEI